MYSCDIPSRNLRNYIKCNKGKKMLNDKLKMLEKK